MRACLTTDASVCYRLQATASKRPAVPPGGTSLGGAVQRVFTRPWPVP